MADRGRRSRGDSSEPIVTWERTGDGDDKEWAIVVYAPVAAAMKIGDMLLGQSNVGSMTIRINGIPTEQQARAGLETLKARVELLLQLLADTEETPS